MDDVGNAINQSFLECDYTLGQSGINKFFRVKLSNIPDILVNITGVMQIVEKIMEINYLENQTLDDYLIGFGDGYINGKDFEIILGRITINGEAIADELIIPKAKIKDISDDNLVITILDKK